MANVAGVAQLMETVGAPASPTTPASTVPAQSFATAMHQANTDAGVPESAPQQSVPTSKADAAPVAKQDTASPEPTPSLVSPTVPAQAAAPKPAAAPLPAQPRYTTANMLSTLLGRTGTAVPPPAKSASTAPSVPRVEAGGTPPSAPSTPVPDASLPVPVVSASTTAIPQVLDASVTLTKGTVLAAAAVKAPSSTMLVPATDTAADRKVTPEKAIAKPALQSQAAPTTTTYMAQAVEVSPFIQVPPPVPRASAEPALIALASVPVTSPTSAAPAPLLASATARSAAQIALASTGSAGATLGSTPLNSAAASSISLPQSAPTSAATPAARIAPDNGSGANGSLTAPAAPTPATTLAPTAATTAAATPVTPATGPSAAHTIAARQLPMQAAGPEADAIAVPISAMQPTSTAASPQASVLPAAPPASPASPGAAPQKTAMKSPLSGSVSTAALNAPPQAVAAVQPGAASAGADPNPKDAKDPKDASHAISPVLQAAVPSAPQTSSAPVADPASTVTTPLAAMHSPVAQTTLSNANGPGLATASAFSSPSSSLSGTSGDMLPHTTLSSTPTTLEVGVSSGTHGWLKIRAELNASGTVDASLTGVNAAATGKLHNDLPALSSFLQNEKVTLGSLNVSAPGAATAALHGAAGSTLQPVSAFTRSAAEGVGPTGTAVASDAGTSGGRAPQQQAQQAQPSLANLREDDGLAGAVSPSSVYGDGNDIGNTGALGSGTYGGGGSWLNVRV